MGEGSRERHRERMRLGQVYGGLVAPRGKAMAQVGVRRICGKLKTTGKLTAWTGLLETLAADSAAY